MFDLVFLVIKLLCIFSILHLGPLSDTAAGTNETALSKRNVSIHVFSVDVDTNEQNQLSGIYGSLFGTFSLDGSVQV